MPITITPFPTNDAFAGNRVIDSICLDVLFEGILYVLIFLFPSKWIIHAMPNLS
ncbi:hypothetical protein M2408_003190 [Sphingobacterium sp. BIGb0165]|nr:hypothetical protein [Sphingobacterium sp. BIGb0165]